MTDIAAPRPVGQSLMAIDARTQKRRKAEARFKAYGLSAIMIGLAMLIYLVFTVVSSGYNGFLQTRITLEIPLVQEDIDKAEKGLLKTSAYLKLIGNALRERVQAEGLETAMKDKELRNILSKRAAARLRSYVQENPDKIGQTVEFKFLAQSFVDGYLKGRVTRDTAERSKNISVAQLDLVDGMRAAGFLNKGFNLEFITGNDASESSPEAAGFGPAILGSFAMMIVVAVGSITIGVAASIFLEEFAPRNRLTDLIEVNISNLAAVPSIVFGILGLGRVHQLPWAYFGHRLVQEQFGLCWRVGTDLDDLADNHHCHARVP